MADNDDFDYGEFCTDVVNLILVYYATDDESPDELAAVRALRDHLNNYPGIDDKPDPWKLRADLIDALALWFIGDDVDYAARDAAHALVAALRSGDVRPG